MAAFLTRTLSAFLNEEDGQSVIEYGILAALISIAAVALLESIGVRVGGFFENVLEAWP